MICAVVLVQNPEKIYECNPPIATRYITSSEFNRLLSAVVRKTNVLELERITRDLFSDATVVMFNLGEVQLDSEDEVNPTKLSFKLILRQGRSQYDQDARLVIVTNKCVDDADAFLHKVLDYLLRN